MVESITFLNSGGIAGSITMVDLRIHLHVVKDQCLPKASTNSFLIQVSLSHGEFYAQRFAKGFGKHYFTGREATLTAKLGSQSLVSWHMWVGLAALLRCWD